MKKERTNKYFIYARRSSESEDRQVLSIDSQIGELQKVAKQEGLKVSRIFQESRSAKALGRPVFAEMLNLVQKGEADGILCWKLDRLARNMVDGGGVINMLQMSAIKHIRTYERSYYPNDNVLLMAVEFGMANQYSRDLAANVTRGLKKKAELGWYPVQPPIGYLNSKTNQKGSNVVYEDSERFDLVRKMWDLMLTGVHSPKSILKTATDDWGLRSRRGLKMSDSNIYALFNNPFYYGRFNFPKTSDVWYDGKHKPMISEDEFNKVQILLGRKSQPRPKRHVFAFVGLMKCGQCGMTITAEKKNKTQKNGNTHQYTYYHCTKHSNKPCDQGSIEEKELNKQIDTELGLLEIPESFHQWGLKWIKKEVEKEQGVRVVATTSQRSAYDAITKKIERLIDMRANEELTESEFLTRKDTAMKEKERLSKLLTDGDDRFNSWANNMETALAFVTKAREKFNKGSTEDRRRIFSAFGSNLLLKERKVIFDETRFYLPMKKLALVVQKINNRLEPPKSVAKQGHIDSLYESSPLVSAL
jgi:site-specific DNA recombinase